MHPHLFLFSFWVMCISVLGCGGADAKRKEKSTEHSVTSESSPLATVETSVKTDEKPPIEIVNAPAPDNPFDNPNFVQPGIIGSSDSKSVDDESMAVKLDFKHELPPLPTANVRQYKRWKQLGRIRVGFSHLDTVRLSPDEKYVMAMSNNEGTVRIYDFKTRKLINNYSILGVSSFGRCDVLFWPVAEKDPMVLVAKKSGLFLYKGLKGEPYASLYSEPTDEIWWTDDLKTLVGTGASKKRRGALISFYKRKSPAALELIKAVSYPRYIWAVDVSRDNRLLAVASNDIKLYDLETGELLWSTPAPSALWSVDISPDGSKVAFGGSHLEIVDSKDPRKKTIYRKFNNNINTVRFSPSGDAVFASAYDGRIRIVSSDLSKPVATLIKVLRHGGTANVYQMAFSKDGNLMVSVSGDQTVRIWGRRKR
ncbi:MAG: hypothetical protein GY854_23425 [Deltaproteobacteria bacterium]|nr:hypothetical protein [Deltaproteobacteria bacterium]